MSRILDLKVQLATRLGIGAEVFIIEMREYEKSISIDGPYKIAGISKILNATITGGVAYASEVLFTDEKSNVIPKGDYLTREEARAVAEKFLNTFLSLSTSGNNIFTECPECHKKYDGWDLNHPCPSNEEVGGKYEGFRCNCCPDCEAGCAQDV